jgi:hypothetical protein
MLGPWRSFLLVDGVPRPEGTIQIDAVDPANGRITGNHIIGGQPKPIDGNILPVGNTFRMRMEREEVNSRARKSYDTTVIIDIPSPAPALPSVVTVMVGLKSSVLGPNPPDAKIKEAALVQDDGTVIITRP